MRLRPRSITGTRRAQPWLGLMARVWILLAVTPAMPTLVGAQGAGVEARVYNVSGRVLVSGRAHPAFVAARGRVLAPGDEIDTRSGGQVVIALSDGSQVIVQPGSLVILKDYRVADSLRELLQILAGRVRIKVNHFGGRANPYRVNSPTASIAVRGTEFDVAVDATGETQVTVYEGVVEVTSRTDPSQKVLVEPGRSVIIRPNGEVRSFIAGLGSGRGDGGATDTNQSQSRNNRVAAAKSKQSQTNSSDTGNTGNAGAGTGVGTRSQSSNNNNSNNNSRNNTWWGASSKASSGEAADAYERDLDSIIAPGSAPFVSRFAAFSDSHLDSFGNPAYATEFAKAEGRVFLLPSFSHPRGPEFNPALFGLGSAHPVDRGLSPQTSLFIPVPQLGGVVGGSFSLSHRSLQSLGYSEVKGSFFSPTTQEATADSTSSTTFNGSLIFARRFGADGRTSLGLALDRLTGQDSFHNLTTQSQKGKLQTRENLDSDSDAARTRFTIGLARDLGRATKLGVSYRYGMTDASDRDRLHTSNGKSLGLDSTLSSGHSSELGLSLRAPITSRLFYGVEGTLLFTNLDAQLKRAVFLNSRENDRAKRGTLGVGIGYALRRRTLIGLDVTGGFSGTNNWWREDATKSLLEAEQQRTRFWALHAAVQTDIWRGLFASASVLTVAQSRTTDQVLYPDRFGRRFTAEGVFAPNSQTRDGSTNYYSHFGAGWRLSSSFLAQYVLSTDYGRTAPSHILLLRYTFSFGPK